MPTQQQLNDQLFTEFFKLQPNEITIHELIQQGADINAVDKYGESLLQTAVESCGQGLELKYVQLLLDLHVNLNHQVDGFNCLFEAMLTYNLELCSMLLMAGVNPNCISSDTHESLLDYSISKLDFMELTEDIQVPTMREFIKLLVSFGAKSNYDS
ncbi:MAG TPA: ankyrin repeat domain-containing protein [Chitinophagaceae bacterium]|nr:ankyrin repeat domain-containing protein [Chitinophagaceae bacterium]